MTRQICGRLAGRVGAAATALVLVGGVGAAPATAAEGIGEDAWWYQDFKIAEAHEKTTGKGVTIAVIDTPIDPSVPELKGQDVVPVRNFCGGKATGTGELASHGTSMVANIVGSGQGTVDGIGVAGVAPGAMVRTYANDSSAARGLQCDVGEDAATGMAIDAAVADRARIVSFSGGSAGASPLMAAAVQRAIQQGVLVVAAAGQAPEDPTVLIPAAVPGVVAVAAIDRNAKPWDRNVVGNREAFVVSGPGVKFTGAGFDGDVWRSTATRSGTSDATAFVAGALALVMAEFPKATGNQVIQHLIRNPGGSGEFSRDTTYGYGIVSVTKMLASDPAQWPDVNPLLPPGSAGAPAEGGAAGAAGSGEVATEPVAALGEESGDSGGPASAVLVGVVVLALVGAGVLVFAVRRSRAGATAGTGVSG